MLYIRHGEKLYDNGKSETFPLDPPLTDFGREEATEYFQSFVHTFGVPSKIVSSPYRRTRQTAKIAQDVIHKQTGVFVPIFVDTLISEYLGNQKNTNLEGAFHPNTEKYSPVPPETWTEFLLRVRLHSRLCTPDTWYVTHGLFIKTLAKWHGTDVPRPSPATGIFVSQKDFLERDSQLVKFVKMKR